MKILVIAAHPDDEVIGCGGTIFRLVQEKHQVSVAILGEGITSRYKTPENADQSLLQNIKSCSEKVAKFLGVHRLFTQELPDNRFDTLPLLDIAKIIEELIDHVKPDVIYTQHGGDLNVDHKIVYRATLTAARPMTGKSIRTVYAYAVASSTEWAFQSFSPIFRPNTFVDIGMTLDRKIEAMQLYDAECRVFPHPRSPEVLRATAQHWGSIVGFAAAEAFELVYDRR